MARPLDHRNLEPYSIVHPAPLIENTETVQLFGRVYRVPAPIQSYLRFEYGRNWNKPKDDHVSRTRIYDFREKEGIPEDWLER